MITVQEAIKFLLFTYPSESPFRLFQMAPFCCEAFVEALYNGELIGYDDCTKVRLRGDYEDEFEIHFCPFCGLRLAALKETENEC